MRRRAIPIALGSLTPDHRGGCIDNLVQALAPHTDVTFGLQALPNAIAMAARYRRASPVKTVAEPMPIGTVAKRTVGQPVTWTPFDFFQK